MPSREYVSRRFSLSNGKISFKGKVVDSNKLYKDSNTGLVVYVNGASASASGYDSSKNVKINKHFII